MDFNTYLDCEDKCKFILFRYFKEPNIHNIIGSKWISSSYTPIRSIFFSLMQSYFNTPIEFITQSLNVTESYLYRCGNNLDRKLYSKVLESAEDSIDVYDRAKAKLFI